MRRFGRMALLTTSVSAIGGATTRVEEVRVLATLGTFSEPGWVQPSSDGRFVVISVDSQLLVFNRQTRQVGNIATGRFAQIALSPAATHLAWRRWSGDTSKLYVATIDLPRGQLGDSHQLAVVEGHSPLFSPDGHSIAYGSSTTGAADSLAVVSLSDNRERKLPAAGSWGMTPVGWSSEGKHLYYTARQPPYERIAPIFRIGLGDAAPERMLASNFLSAARLSPDRRSLLHAPTSDSIAISRLDGTRVRGLGSDWLSQGNETSDPEWLPGSTSLVATSLFQPRVLVSYPLSAGPAQVLSDSSAYTESPAISPDGQWLAALTSSGAEPRLLIRSLSGLNARVLPLRRRPVGNYHHTALQWSPDGRYLAVPTGTFEGNSHPGPTGLSVVELATSKEIQLQTATGSVGRYAWSPDSRAIRYVFTTRDTVGNPGQVHEISLSGGDRVVRVLYRCCAAMLFADYDHIYIRDDGQLVDLATGARRTIVDSTQLPAPAPVRPIQSFSRDGRWLAMATSASGRGGFNRVLIASMNTPERRLLDPGLRQIPPEGVVFLADGMGVMVSGRDSTGVPRAVLLSLDGAERRQIAQLDGGRIGLVQFALSPLGDQLVVSHALTPKPLRLLEISVRP